MFTDKNEKPIVAVLLILVVGLIISLMFAMTDRPLFAEPTVPPPYPDDAVMCTMDAKICPDGSSVGRIPPSCEFSPCPGEDEEIPIGSVPTIPATDDAIGGGMGVCTMEAKMCPDGETFVSRSGADCAFAPCPSEGSALGGRGDDIACIELYAPVCASVDVECIKAPCPAMEQTFSNECEANKADAEVLHEGECE